MQSKQAEDGGESCRVNRQRMEETELQSKQAEGERERELQSKWADRAREKIAE